MPDIRGPRDAEARTGPRVEPWSPDFKRLHETLPAHCRPTRERYSGEWADREVTQYRNDAGRLVWGWRCWGGDICGGRVGLDYETESSARFDLDRHYAESHTTA